MKKIIVLIIGFCLSILLGFSQTHNVDQVLDQMSNTYNQFNDKFDLDDIKDELTIIYIPGTNDPFGKFYNKYAGKKMVDDVQVIGGFKEMMQKMNEKTKVSHLQDALKARFKEDSFSILIDSKSVVEDQLSLEGYSIIKISKKHKKVISKDGFGTDRAAFFKALKPFLKQ